MPFQEDFPGPKPLCTWDDIMFDDRRGEISPRFDVFVFFSETNGNATPVGTQQHHNPLSWLIHMTFRNVMGYDTSHHERKIQNTIDCVCVCVIYLSDLLCHYEYSSVDFDLSRRLDLFGLYKNHLDSFARTEKVDSPTFSLPNNLLILKSHLFPQSFSGNM